MERCVISIIVPVYKAEKYLSRCIASLLSQSFTAFELLLIDDGSPDNSGKICNDWAAKTAVFAYCVKRTRGQRGPQQGLDEARGEYIVFVDSDDYVGADYLKHLYEEAVGSRLHCDTGIYDCVGASGQAIYNRFYSVYVCRSGYKGTVSQ